MKTLRKVLVVDDDPVVGKSFERVLTGRGYAVVTASDGAQALSKIAAEDYDVVYTDIRMPGMDGIAVAEQIRASQPWLPVVIVSGYATTENEARAKAAGVCAVLHKPLSPQMIEDSAREALAQGQARAAIAAGPDAVVQAPVERSEPAAAAKPTRNAWKEVGLALAAPIVGLAYVLLAPFAGLVALAVLPFWFAARALARRSGRMKTWSKNVALFLAAPFVGLAYVISLPFVGLGVIAWIGVKAAYKRAHKA